VNQAQSGPPRSRLSANLPLLESRGEEEFARLLRARSEAAWEMLFERHFDRVYRYALVHVSTSEVAEDIAETTFGRALATIDSFSYQRRPILAWLYGNARKIVKETRCRGSRERSTALADRLLPWQKDNLVPAAMAPMQPDASDGLAVPTGLQVALRHLTEKQREVVLFRYFVGLSAAETGQVIGRPEKAVYALQAEALAELRRRLE